MPFPIYCPLYWISKWTNSFWVRTPKRPIPTASSASNKLAFVHDCGLEDVTRGNVLPRGEDVTNKGTLLHCSFLREKKGIWFFQRKALDAFAKEKKSAWVSKWNTFAFSIQKMDIPSSDLLSIWLLDFDVYRWSPFLYQTRQRFLIIKNKTKFKMFR